MASSYHFVESGCILFQELLRTFVFLIPQHFYLGEIFIPPFSMINIFNQGEYRFCRCMNIGKRNSPDLFLSCQ
jgi:hypothetical protein